MLMRTFCDLALPVKGVCIWRRERNGGMKGEWEGEGIEAPALVKC